MCAAPGHLPRGQPAAGFSDCDFAYGLGEADVEAAGEALGEVDPAAAALAAFFSARLAFRASSAAFSCSVGGPTFTVLAIKVPSASFQ